MTTENDSSTSMQTLPDSNIYDDLNDLKTHYDFMDPSTQEKFDILLGFHLSEDPGRLYNFDHQNDPHLFLRVCFFLVRESLKALQAWAAISRYGFDVGLHLNGTGDDSTADVLVSQFREGYSITMGFRLKEATKLLDAPGWLFERALSVPVPEYIAQLFTDENDMATQDAPDATQQDAAPYISSEPSFSWFNAPQADQSTSDTSDVSTLSREPTLVDNTLPSVHPSSGFSWSANLNGSNINTGTPSLNAVPAAGASIYSSSSNGDDFNHNSQPLTRTPTILNEAPPSDARDSFHSGDDRSFSSASHAGGTLIRVPTLLNMAPSSLVNPTSVGNSDTDSDDLERTDTVSTIQASNEQLTADVSTQNGLTLSRTSSDQSSWGIETSRKERRARRKSREGWVSHKVRRLESLRPFTRSEQQLLDPAVGSQPSEESSQEVSNSSMDVDPHDH